MGDVFRSCPFLWVYMFMQFFICLWQWGLLPELCFVKLLKELAGIHDAVRAGAEDFACASSF